MAGRVLNKYGAISLLESHGAEVVHVIQGSKEHKLTPAQREHAMFHLGAFKGTLHIVASLDTLPRSEVMEYYGAMANAYKILHRDLTRKD